MTRRGLFTIITGAIAGLKAARKPFIYLKARAVGFTTWSGSLTIVDSDGAERPWMPTEAQRRLLDYMDERDRLRPFHGGRNIRTPFFYHD